MSAAAPAILLGVKIVTAESELFLRSPPELIARPNHSFGQDFFSACCTLCLFTARGLCPRQAASSTAF